MASRSLRRILCYFGIHRRSRGSIHESGNLILGNCRHCRVPMYKIDGKWMVRR